MTDGRAPQYLPGSLWRSPGCRAQDAPSTARALNPESYQPTSGTHLPKSWRPRRISTPGRCVPPSATLLPKGDSESRACVFALSRPSHILPVPSRRELSHVVNEPTDIDSAFAGCLCEVSITPSEAEKRSFSASLLFSAIFFLATPVRRPPRMTGLATRHAGTAV